MYEYKATIVNVVDGDTVDAFIDLGFNVFVSQRVRIDGIDAPETRTLNRVEKECGLNVKKIVEGLVLNKDLILHSKKGISGKYGRYLGDFYVDQAKTMSLGQMLLDLNLVKVYTEGPRPTWGDTELKEMNQLALRIVNKEVAF